MQELYVVEHCDKFVPKFDGLQKHVGHWKAKFAHPRVHVGEYSMSLKIQHSKNNKLKFVRLQGKNMSFKKWWSPQAEMSICANCCNIPCHKAKVIDDGD